jgi:type II restriction enzyme
MKRDFEDIMKNLKETIADYSYYTNFKKVFENVNKYKVELNILNSLIGSSNMKLILLKF